jgi:RNA polymerase sigma-70 factor, ECF subfamily
MSLPERLYEELHRCILAYFRKRTGSVEKAEDLAQEAILKLLRRLEAGESVANPEAYLFRSARNLLIDYYRGRRETTPVAELAELPDDSQEVPEDRKARLEIASWMRRFIGYLPDPYRETLLLADIEGVPYSRIAGRMGVTEGTVKSRVHRGRKLLRKELTNCCRFAFDARGRVVDYEPLHRTPQDRRKRPVESNRSNCTDCN